MKKIIQHGKFVKYYFVCENCGCEFIMDAQELQMEQQSLVFLLQSNCPECNCVVRGKEKDENW